MTEREHHNIEMLAYHLWCNRGYPEGQAHSHWLEAERILNEYLTHSPVTSETSLFGFAAFFPDKDDS